MNKKLFAIVAAAALTSSVSFARTDAWYTSLTAGTAFKGDTKTTDSSSNLSQETGFGSSFAVGHSFDQFRSELEIGYNHLGLKRDKVADTPIKGHISLMTIMGNVYYDIPLTAELDMYVGAGFGYGREKIKIKGGTDTFGANVFAYQLMAGPAWNINQNWTISAGYRFIGTSKGKGTIDDVKIKAKSFAIHRVEAAVRYSF